MRTRSFSQRDFVANASHQLRTPLTGLRLRLEAAALKSEDPGVRRDLEAAEHETERLATLLNGLLALARERTPRRRPHLCRWLPSSPRRPSGGAGRRAQRTSGSWWAAIRPWRPGWHARTSRS